MITLIFQCGGCFEEASALLGRTFISVTGRPYGFGRWQTDNVADLAPEGWVVFDPYTQATYCPECWAGIETRSEKGMIKVYPELADARGIPLDSNNWAVFSDFECPRCGKTQPVAATGHVGGACIRCGFSPSDVGQED